MVYVCSLTSYPSDEYNKKKQYFEKFDFPLHIFQKWAIHGLIELQHVLVTAPTGSGKSLPAEFAIDYFHSLGKKTIYCSPIKALSNQKFYDFTYKYPHISIGLITGDIKTNPDADVLIMTTEILLNKLYQLKSKQESLNSSVSFDMNIENELACVIFDEIHMINDEDRGHVWENSIMMMPNHIQIVGLSATLDDPEKFAYWMENKGNQVLDYGTKKVYLTKKTERSVPLTHYSYIISNSSVFKHIKDKSTQQEIRKFTNKFHVIQDAKGKFDDSIFQSTNKFLKLFDSNHIRVKRMHVLNEVSKLLFEQQMLPAICYVFSRKQVDICAKEITTPLIDTDNPINIKYECEQIIRKLPNYKEYLYLPEYITLIAHLEKGIATHHSGMMPVLREIVELMFSKGYIKLLFCTESVAIGLNLPVKTTIFTDINKHDGNQFRKLYGHEFVQASGRAGRLGIDTVGNVIHLFNLFKDVDSLTYKQMMQGKPQSLTSKFKISYNLILNLINSNEHDLVDFAKKSMITGDLENELKLVFDDINKLNQKIDNLNLIICSYLTPKDVIKEYIQLNKDVLITRNKKQKTIQKRISDIKNKYCFIDKEKKSFDSLFSKESQLVKLEEEFKTIQSYIKSGIDNINDILILKNYIEFVDNNYKLTFSGLVASHLRELPCLSFSLIIENNCLNEFTPTDLICLFSCFTNITVSDDLKEYFPNSKNYLIKEVLEKIIFINKEITLLENEKHVTNGDKCEMQFDLLNLIDEWCVCNDVDSCKLFIKKLEVKKEIYLGEFVKALIKINNIASEVEKICELIGNITLLSNIKQIPDLTLKYVVTNQSLYL